MTIRCSLLLMLLAGTGCLSELTGPTTEPAPTGTRMATIEVVDAVISPGKSNHTVWDAVGTVPNDVWSGLATALAASEPFGAVTGFLNTQSPLIPRPDPFGTATLLSTYSAEDGVDSPLATNDNNLQDTFTPTWPTRSHWEDVALTSDLRVRVSLTDEDLSEHDPIGVVELSSHDIDAAIAAGQVLHVKVSGQATGQILFVGLWAQETGVAQ